MNSFEWKSTTQDSQAFKKVNITPYGLVILHSENCGVGSALCANSQLFLKVDYIVESGYPKITKSE